MSAEARSDAQPTTLETARLAVAWSFTRAGLRPEHAEQAAVNVENLLRAACQGGLMTAPPSLESLHCLAFGNVCAGQRPGQALFNALRELRPDIAESIRGTDADPFHVREVPHPKFTNAVCTIEREWSA